MAEPNADWADRSPPVIYAGVTVDTAVAHLAGALGKPTWLLLPFAADWRWLLDRNDTPWYPNTRLFRQQTPGDWPELIDRVATELHRLAKG